MVQARKIDPAVEKPLTVQEKSATVAVLAEHRQEKAGVARAAKFSLRDCTFQDIDDCITLGREMHRESAYSQIPFDDVAVRALIEVAIMSDKYKALVARDIHGEMIGMMLFATAKYFFSREYFGQDVCSYVTPTWRGSTVFLRMLSQVIIWAMNHKLMELEMSTTTKVNTSEFESIMERLQFVRVGSAFKLNLKEI